VRRLRALYASKARWYRSQVVGRNLWRQFLGLGLEAWDFRTRSRRRRHGDWSQGLVLDNLEVDKNP